MTDEPPTGPLKPKSPLGQEIGAKAARKLRAQRHVKRTVWFGLGMMGLIGWSVTIPTLLGAALGIWLDQRFPGGRSWTLALLVAGLAIGCWNAWYWVTREDKAIQEERQDGDE
ncbi:MAG: AtpZ/AtpI family protein [Bryobacterales bacterium]|nr:AtpZ/AtpI family protein [Bryobacterales bacterium]